MKKKNALKKTAVKLDLEKIEIDFLSDSMLNGLQGGYNTQPGPFTVCSNPCGGTNTCTCLSVVNYCTGNPGGTCPC